LRGRDLNPRPSGYEPALFDHFTLLVFSLLPLLLPLFTV
jgi:hypothetical protein